VSNNEILLNQDELIKKLQTDIMEVDFIKKDGTLRKMICTLQKHIVPEVLNPRKRNKSTEDLVTVYDLEKEGWRSFHFKTVQNIKHFDWAV